MEQIVAYCSVVPVHRHGLQKYQVHRLQFCITQYILEILLEASDASDPICPEPVRFQLEIFLPICLVFCFITFIP